ncbi:fimbrial protein [Erwiniaceae bacterium CAU 1747]
MKITALGIALMLPFVVYADNTVTFLGEVSDSTCNVTVNGTTGNVSVLLPTTPAGDLAEAAKTAGATPFKFVVGGCTAATEKTVGMRLVPVSTTTGGNLKNLATANPADNVSIQIIDNYNNGTSTINFSSGEYVTPTLVNLPTGTSQLEFPFTAQYYATGAASIGKVETQLQYALTYK